eukprot:COSAG02_NODE_1089_length_14662_cov_100.768180_3_plen_62_part_00
MIDGPSWIYSIIEIAAERIRYCLERFVSHRSVSRVSDAEIASEILLVVSHLEMFLSYRISN